MERFVKLPVRLALPVTPSTTARASRACFARLSQGPIRTKISHPPVRVSFIESPSVVDRDDTGAVRQNAECRGREKAASLIVVGGLAGALAGIGKSVWRRVSVWQRASSGQEASPGREDRRA